MLLFSLAFATAFVVHKSADKTANATPADPSESNALTITVDDVRETIETNSSGVYAVMPSITISRSLLSRSVHRMPKSMICAILTRYFLYKMGTM